MKTIQDFVEENNITFKFLRIEKREDASHSAFFTNIKCPQLHYEIRIYSNNFEVLKFNYTYGAGLLKVPKCFENYFFNETGLNYSKNEYIKLPQKFYKLKNEKDYKKLQKLLYKYAKFKPELYDILESIHSDITLYEDSVDFKNWCSNLGHNDDSITDLSIYNACKELADNFRKKIGLEAYSDFVNNIKIE